MGTPVPMHSKMGSRVSLFQLTTWLADDCTGFLNANVANSVCNLVGQCCYGLPTSNSGCRGNGKKNDYFYTQMLRLNAFS